MLRRMIGVAMLNASVFEEIEADKHALGPAVAIVILVTICGIVGDALGVVIGGEGLSVGLLVSAVLNGVLFGLLSWVLWVSLLLLVGGVMLRAEGTETSWDELARVVGFAYTPSLLVLLSFVPMVGGWLALAARIWTLAAVVVGIRQALDYESTGRAILVAVIAGAIGLIPWLILEVIQLIVT